MRKGRCAAQEYGTSVSLAPPPSAPRIQLACLALGTTARAWFGSLWFVKAHASTARGFLTHAYKHSSMRLGRFGFRSQKCSQ
jgi:hypothetical protein